MNSADYLSRFDTELNEVLATQRRREEDAESEGSAATRHIAAVPVQQATWGNFYPSDWRFIVAFFFVVAIVIPVAFYMLEPHIQAPPPHGSAAGTSATGTDTPG